MTSLKVSLLAPSVAPACGIVTMIRRTGVGEADNSRHHRGSLYGPLETPWKYDTERCKEGPQSEPHYAESR